MPSNPRHLVTDNLAVEVHPDAASLGWAAARAVAAAIASLLEIQTEARVVFACAPSQDQFLAALIEPRRCGVAVDWARVTAFHMDDYVGLPASHPQSFRHYLQTHLLDHASIGRFHPIPAESPDRARVCREYAALLAERPIDLICLGIGENGHIAFNDPPVADFEDPFQVKEVELDRACREQQVHDGCFASLADVPTHALTLTVPVFRRARRLSIHVPGPRKAAAVAAAVEGPIATSCPASILRRHPNATLYLDRDSAQALSTAGS